MAEEGTQHCPCLFDLLVSLAETRNDNNPHVAPGWKYPSIHNPEPVPESDLVTFHLLAALSPIAASVLL